jgi:hypothetical protein
MTNCIATFETTSMALQFERTCRKNGYNVRVVPVPRSISTSCGMACHFPCGKKEAIEALCREKGIEVSGYHEMQE